MSDRLKGKVAIITGGASGIGAACVRRFVAEGAAVIITDIDDTGGSTLAESLGDRALFLQQDVTDADRWVEVIDTTVDRFGRLDILVNNAGIGAGEPIETESLENWRHIMSVNADSAFLGCRTAVNAMKDNGSGSIINLSSIHGLKGNGGVPSYSAAKGAVRLLTKSVATWCGQAGYNIRCNSVHPGYIDTPLLHNAFDHLPDSNEIWDSLVTSHALGRLGTPEEVAGAVLFLASDDASFVTGSEMVVDGGYMNM